MTQPPNPVRGLLIALIAIVAMLAVVTTAHADIRLQPVRSIDAQEGTVVPKDRIVSFDDAGGCAPGEFVIQINWGDGTTSPGEITFTDEIIGIDLEPLRCVYEASGAHTYRTAATAPLSVSVCRGAECRASSGRQRVGRRGADRRRARERQRPRRPRLRGPHRALPRRQRARRGVRLRRGHRLGRRLDVRRQRHRRRRPLRGRGCAHVRAAGARALRVTLLQAGAERVAVGGTISVAPPRTARRRRGAGAPDRIVANSARGARSSLRLRSRSLTRSALRRGLPIASRRAGEPAHAAPGDRQRDRLGEAARTVTVRLRGGKVAGGVRTLDARVRLSAALRRKLQPRHVRARGPRRARRACSPRSSGSR